MPRTRSTSSKKCLDTVLLHLPQKELQHYLLDRLDLKSLKAARCVSKLWQSLIDPFMEFHIELSDTTKPYVQAFGTSRQVTSLATTVLQGNYPSDGIQVRTKMLRVTVDILDGNESFQQFQRRQNDKQLRNIGLTHFNFRQVVFDFQYVSKFHIASLAVASFGIDAKRQLARVYLPNVKDIIITFFDGGFHQLLPFMRNYFPKLQSVNIANVAGTRKDRPILYSWIFGFVGRHRETLSEVSLILPEGMLDSRGSIGGLAGGPAHGNRRPTPGVLNIRRDLRYDLKTPHNIYLEIKNRLLSFTNLKKLIWDVSMLEGHRRYTLGHTLLFAQLQLVDLHLDNLHLKDIPLWNRIGELVKKLAGTLESISLGGCFCGPSTALLGAHVFNCTWLKDCKRLKSLEMTVCGVSVDSIEDLPFDSIKTLNLGHMLIQEQIEHVARHMVNLQWWVLPQRGCLVNILVPKVSLYLFQTILHLPKLEKVSLMAECADHEDIIQFCEEQQGVSRCCCRSTCLVDAERNGNLNFHIERDTFIREHSQLEEFISKNRVNPVENLNRDDLVEFFIRNIIAGRIVDIHHVDGDDLDDDEDEDFVVWDEDDLQVVGLNNFFVL